MTVTTLSFSSCSLLTAMSSSSYLCPGCLYLAIVGTNMAEILEASYRELPNAERHIVPCKPRKRKMQDADFDIVRPLYGV